MRPPSHEIRKFTIVLPAHIVEALHPKLLGDESITECIKRLVREAALGDDGYEPDDFDDYDRHPSMTARERNPGLR